MPGNLTTRALLFLCGLLPHLFTFAQSAPPPCFFDVIHRERLKEDRSYQMRQRIVDTTLHHHAAERLRDGYVHFRGEDSLFRIPVVVHILYAPGTPGGSMFRPGPSQIRNSLDRLNDGFRRRGSFSEDPQFTDAGIPAADAGIEFVPAQLDPQGLPTSGITQHATPLVDLPIDDTVDGVEVLDSLRRLAAWPATHYLNIYVLPQLCDLSNDCPVGFSYSAAAHGRDFDGVYVFSKALITETEILIHEVGHYLNLYHTFEDGCSETDCLTGGDRVCDTPPDCYPFNCGGTLPNCLQGDHQNSCSNDADIANSPFTTDVEDIYENFMDYGIWKCFKAFTPGQSRRMRDALHFFRSSLLQSPAFFPPDTCSMDTFSVLALDSCAADGVYATTRLQLEYRHPPDSGRLQVNDSLYAITGSPQTIPFSFPAGTAPPVLRALFTRDTACAITLDSLPVVPACLSPRELRCRAAPIVTAGTDSCRQMVTLPFHQMPEFTSSCAPSAGAEAGMKLLVPATGSVQLNLSATEPLPLYLHLFDHCEETAFYCDSITQARRWNFILDSLPAGDTLLMVFRTAQSITTDSLRLCLKQAPQPPGNDDLLTAMELPLSDPRLGRSCTAQRRVDFTGATGTPWTTGCAPSGLPDVWFALTVPDAGDLRVETLGAGALQTGISAYTSRSRLLLGCSRLSDRGRPELLLEDLPPGDTVFLRLYATEMPAGDVQVCASLPAKRPANDDCHNAFPLAVSQNGCSGGIEISNIASSPSGVSSNCEMNLAEDLWYSVVVPPGGTLTIEAYTGAGFTSPGLAAFTGCGGTELACRAPDGQQGQLALSGLQPGDTVIFALWDFFHFEFGSIRLCVSAPPPPLNDACHTAFPLPVCPDSSCAPFMVTGLTRATPEPSGCSPSNAGALWYRMVYPNKDRLLVGLATEQPGASGIMVFSACGGQVLHCLTSNEGSAIDSSLFIVNANPGDTLLVAVWSERDTVGLRAFGYSCPEPEYQLQLDSIHCHGEENGAAAITFEDRTGWTIEWSNGSKASNVAGLSPGRHTVTITGAYGCGDTIDFQLADPPPLEGFAEATSSGTERAEGSIRIYASGGSPPYSYQLEGNAFQAAPLFEGLLPGNYQVAIRDASGCLWTDSTQVALITGLKKVVWLESLRLFPNPATDMVNVEMRFKGKRTVQLSLCNAMGQVISRKLYRSQAFIRDSWDTTHLPPGLYLLEVESEGRRRARLFTITKPRE